MGYVVNKETMQPMTYEQAQEHSNANPHIIDGVEFVLTLAFSEEGLQGTRYAMLDTGDMPILEPIYYKLELSSVAENDGKYSATWVPLPSDFPIEKISEKKLADMRAACEEAIVGDGFHSSALGTQHKYSSDRDAQSNLTFNVMKAAMLDVDVYHHCYTASGERIKALHTPAQIQQVAADLEGHMWPKFDRCQAKREEINEAVAANDKVALIEISWT